MLVSCLAYSLTLKAEATYCTKTSVDVQQTTRHYIPHDIEFFQKLVYLLGNGSMSNSRAQSYMSQMLNILSLELVDLQPEAALGSQ
jgi:hypothetical protein